MTTDGRRFQRMQALEQEVKALFSKIDISAANGVAPSGATTGLVADITYTSATLGILRNADTITIQVLAPAANPTDTVLLVVTGTIDAVILTVTPNDGTNNGATPVDLTTAQLVLAINANTSGVFGGVTVTITDAGSLLLDLSTVGGDATALADAGEGDGEAATLVGGAAGPGFQADQIGFKSIARSSAGKYSITLEDIYQNIENFSGIVLRSTSVDLVIQLVDDTVAVDGTFDILINTGTTATDLLVGDVLYLELELKNSGV